MCLLTCIGFARVCDASFCSFVRYGNIRWSSGGLFEIQSLHTSIIFIIRLSGFWPGNSSGFKHVQRSFKHAPKWQTREFRFRDVAIQCTNWITATCERLPQPWSTGCTEQLFLCHNRHWDKLKNVNSKGNIPICHSAMKVTVPNEIHYFRYHLKSNLAAWWQ